MSTPLIVLIVLIVIFGVASLSACAEMREHERRYQKRRIPHLDLRESWRREYR